MHVDSSRFAPSLLTALAGHGMHGPPGGPKWLSMHLQSVMLSEPLCVTVTLLAGHDVHAAVPIASL
eukprot:354199-Rhodomonas_salina.2